MDSSPDDQPGDEHAEVITLEDRTISDNGQFSIPDKDLFGLEVSHKDLGIFKIDGVPFSKTIYMTEGGVRSTVDLGVRKALDIDKGDSVDIKLYRTISNKRSK